MKSATVSTTVYEDEDVVDKLRIGESQFESLHMDREQLRRVNVFNVSDAVQ